MRRARLLALALVALLVLCSLLLIRVQPRSTLLDHAARLAEVGDWTPHQCTYGWLSDEGILLVRADGSESEYAAHHVAERLDTRTGSLTPVPGLNKRFPKVVNAVVQWKVSPDGKWLLWGDPLPGGGWRVSAVDGSTDLRIPGGPSQWDLPQTIWTADSKGWAYVEGDRPSTVSMFRLGERAASVKPISAMLGTMSAAGWIAPDRLMTVGRGVHLYDGNIQVTEVNTADSSRQIRWQQMPDEVTEVEEALVSPDGKRIAWSCKCHPISLSMRVRRQQLRGIRPASGTFAMLCTSDLGGGGMREIGRVAENKDFLQGLHSVRWSPDSSRLSFVCRGVLWAVPAQ